MASSVSSVRRPSNRTLSTVPQSLEPHLCFVVSPAILVQSRAELRSRAELGGQGGLEVLPCHLPCPSLLVFPVVAVACLAGLGPFPVPMALCHHGGRTERQAPGPAPLQHLPRRGLLSPAGPSCCLRGPRSARLPGAPRGRGEKQGRSSKPLPALFIKNQTVSLPSVFSFR
jgi:hypothetical protein